MPRRRRHPPRHPPLTPASLDNINAQIKELAQRSVTNQKPGPCTRHADCFVIGTSDRSETQGGMTLGPYARWLVAVRLVLLSDKSETLSEALSTPESLTNAFFTRDGNPDKWPKEGHRYFSPDASGKFKKVLSAILERLDLTYERSRGGTIRVKDFIGQHVPVGSAGPSGDLVIGEEAFSWFEHWLRYGAGFPSRASLENLPKLHANVQEELEQSQPFEQAVDLLSRPDQALGCQRIINVHGKPLVTPADEKVQPYSAFAVKLASSVARPVVYVRLSGGISRRRVLKQLYDAFHIPTAALDALDHRPIDLALDLAPVRRAVTVNDVLLIFDAWQNSAGIFAALDEYLCNSHWAEFLRVLAQPDETVCWDSSIAAEMPTLRYALLVVTAREASQLSPWARFIYNPTSRNEKTVRAQQLAAASRRSALTVKERTQPEFAGIKEIRDWVDSVRKGDSKAAEAWEKLGASMCRRLVAASVNGVRADTLRRCLDHWHRLFWVVDTDEGIKEPDNSFNSAIDTLLDQPGLTLGEDEAVERLSAVRRSLELDARPGVVQPVTAAGPNDLFKFKTPALRAEFVKRWLKDESAFKGTDEDLRLNRCSWSHVNYLLGEESLRQGTSQILHLQTPDVCDPYEVRRVVQAIYHGLMSLQLREEDFACKTVRRGLLYGPMFPPDVGRRYKYLYTFLFSHVVEEDVWKITSAFGRTDIRVDLLTLFLSPRSGQLLLTDMDATEPDPFSHLTLDEIPPYLSTDHRMWSNLLLAMARSGRDLGGTRGDSAAKWALRMLPGGDDDSALTHALLPPRSSGAYHRTVASALKARIDWLQDAGHFKTQVVAGQTREGAAGLCMRELKWLGVGEQLLDDLRRDVKAAYETLWRPTSVSQTTSSSSNLADSLQDALTKALETLKKTLRSSSPSRDAASSALFSLARVLATEEDEKRSSGAAEVSFGESEADQRLHERRSHVATYVYICALCWLADNVRIGYGSPKRMGMKWPLAGAQFMRFYIRVILKLAELLAEAHPEALLKSSSNAKSGTAPLAGFVVRLLEHAQHRQGVYVRQHRVRRERVAILLLEVARLRTWMRIELLKRARGVASPETQKFAWYWRLLETSQSLLQEAANHLFSLGLQQVHVRRLCLERIETAETMALVINTLSPTKDDLKEAQTTHAEIRRHEDEVSHLLEVLKQAAGTSHYWEKMVERWSKHLSRTRTKVA